MIRTDVWCTNCQRRFLAELNLELNGNHRIACPLCQHIHYRVVKDGVVTEDRWRSSAGPTFTATTYNFQVNYNYSTSSTGSYFLSNSWLNITNL